MKIILTNENNKFKFFIIIWKTENEKNALQKRITLLEEEYEKVEERLTKATQNLNEASHAADENERYLFFWLF